ncbi:MAG: thioredoxin domain-containing protein, partial [Candidatus Hodarchaeales archaeon]
AKAAQVFDNKYYVESAEKALNFILKIMLQKNGELLHRYRRGDAKISGYADDYAFLIQGLIELYQATYNPKYLQISLELNNYLIDHFWDKNNGGLFFTSDTNEKLLIRTKEIYDGAIPSANSVSMLNFTRLARITGNADLEKKAMGISKAFSDQINKMPSGYTHMMTGLDFAIGPSFEIVIVGNKDNKKTQEIIQNVNSIYLPNKVIILKEIKSKEQIIERLVPFIKDYSQIKNQPTIYICKNQQCQLPTTDIKKMKQFLD